MNAWLSLALCVLAGAGLGMVFFGGLWWTLRKALASRRPASWLIGGGLARMAVALGGIYLVAGGRWERLLACMLGFVIARMVVLRLPQRDPARPAPSATEAGHATQS